jgi:hypothetical protein
MFAVSSFAQQTVDSNRYNSSVHKVLEYFGTKTKIQSGIYNGPEYVFYSRKADTNVFFQSQVYFNPAVVNYDGNVYANVPVMYDLFKDQVITLFYDKFSAYTLLNPKLSDFTLLNHHFVYKDEKEANGLKSGIYDQLYNGATEVLVKRVKNVLIAEKQKTTYPEKDIIYIKNSNSYYEVGSQGRMFKILKDKKLQLKKYVDDVNLDFGRDKEKAVSSIASYYDSLLNQK